MKFAILICLNSFLISCHDNITTIKGCCEDPALWVSMNNGQILIPNIFTPNGDQVHDRWIIYGDAVLIKEIKIWNGKDILIFHRTNIPINDYETSWDGQNNGQPQIGMYDYEIIAEFPDSTIHMFEGRVCNFQCGLGYDDVEIEQTNCFFELIQPPVSDGCF